MSNDLNVFIIKYGFLVLLVGLIIFSQFLQVDLQDQDQQYSFSISSHNRNISFRRNLHARS